MIGFDIAGIIIAVLYTLLIVFLFYWVIKKAVKNGTIEAHKELRENNQNTQN